MDAREFLGGSYLKAVDITQPTVVTIRDAAREVVGQGQQQETKVVVYFNEVQKGVVCNKTNLGALVQAFGADTDRWAGQRVELYRDTCLFQGRPTDCLRLRSAGGPPPPASAAAPLPAGPSPVPASAMQTPPPPQPGTQSPAGPGAPASPSEGETPIPW